MIFSSRTFSGQYSLRLLIKFPTEVLRRKPFSTNGFGGKLPVPVTARSKATWQSPKAMHEGYYHHGIRLEIATASTRPAVPDAGLIGCVPVPIDPLFLTRGLLRCIPAPIAMTTGRSLLFKDIYVFMEFLKMQAKRSI